MTVAEGARAAGPGDLEVLAALAEAGVSEKTDQRGGRVWQGREARRPPWRESFERDLADDAAHVVVGLLDDVVVGYGAVRAEALGDGRLLGAIGDLFVLEDARDLGVGEAMVGLLIDWSRERGCCGIDAVALPGDRSTKNFFETFGLVARAILVHRSLDDEGPAGGRAAEATA